MVLVDRSSAHRVKPPDPLALPRRPSGDDGICQRGGNQAHGSGGKEQGIFDQTEQELIHSVFEFTETSVKEVMIPRPQIDAIELDTPLEEALKLIVETGYSRYPVYRKSLDDICGVLYYKDLLRLQLEHRQVSLQTIIHPPSSFRRLCKSASS